MPALVFCGSIFHTAGNAFREFALWMPSPTADTINLDRAPRAKPPKSDPQRAGSRKRYCKLIDSVNIFRVMHIW
jgi:hypothetical protein